MIQRGSRLALSAKPFQRVGVASDYFWKEFECHKAIEADIVRFVYHAHATTAKFLDNAVMRNGLVKKRLRVSHVLAMLVCARKHFNAVTWIAEPKCQPGLRRS